MPETAKKPGKQPADHKPKSEPVAEPEAVAPPDQIRTITYEGHDYLIDPANLDDVEFMEALVAAEEQPYRIVRATEMMLGGEQWQAFKQNHRDEAGRITSSKLNDFMTAVDAQLPISTVGN